MNNIVTVGTVEIENEQRARAFMQAREQLERQYNCTTTIVPKWETGVHGTFVLSFDEQVAVGPVPEGWEERGNDE